MSVRTKHWTREEYDRLVASGTLVPGARVQLIQGDIVEMTPQDAAHAVTVRAVEEALRSAFARGYDVRVQLPLGLLHDSEPEPDVAVVPGTFRDYRGHHPETAALVVEIADTTLRYDRTSKAAVYAKGRIPEYWVVNLPDRQLEVYRDPDPEGGVYRARAVLGETDSVSPLANQSTRIEVRALLP